MIIDAEEVPRDSCAESDLSIIGAGTAGITIAREFASGRVSVCLLESGRFEPEEVTNFSGHITDVGIQRGPGQVGGVEYRIRGHFKLDQDLDLGASVVTLESLFAEL